MTKITLYILRCDITDHYATAIVFPIFNNHNNHSTLSNNSNLRKININHLDLLVKTEDWLSCFNSSNVDSMVDIFNSKMEEFIKYSSISSDKIKPKQLLTIKAWITTGIITSIRNREKLFSKLRHRPFNLKFKNFYKLYRNMLNFLIRKSKQMYYKNKLKQYKSDSTQMWKVINEIIGKSRKQTNKIYKITNKDDIVIESNPEICNELNDFL